MEYIFSDCCFYFVFETMTKLKRCVYNPNKFKMFLRDKNGILKDKLILTIPKYYDKDHFEIIKFYEVQDD